MDDLPLIFSWLRLPHVRKWYAPEPSTFNEVAAKYGPRTESASPVRSFVVQVEGSDVGYIQAYAIDLFPDYAALLEIGEGAAGVDLFLADPARLNRGLGSRVVTRFVDEIVFGRLAARHCVAGPSAGNQASIRAFEKAGFRQWKLVRPTDTSVEMIMRKDLEC